jgi:hypothetical protein
VFEIQDFGSHVEHMDRSGYRRELNRGLYLQSLGYIVIYISLDELKENPELVRSLVRTILSPYTSNVNNQVKIFTKFEKELMRFAIRRNRLLRPIEASRELDVKVHTVIRYARKLSNKGKLRPLPIGKSGRITCYEYIGTAFDAEIL